MEQYNFSNSNIDLACEETGTFLASAGVERREALRVTKERRPDLLEQYIADGKLTEEEAELLRELEEER